MVIPIPIEPPVGSHKHTKNARVD